jgi:hypothetical protein
MEFLFAFLCWWRSLDDILHSFIEKTFFFRVRKTVLCVVVAYVFQTRVHHGFEYGAKNECIEMSSITQKLTQNYLFQLKLILGCILIHQCWSPPTVKTLPKLNPTTNFAQNWQFFALTKEINCLIYF